MTRLDKFPDHDDTKEAQALLSEALGKYMSIPSQEYREALAAAIDVLILNRIADATDYATARLLERLERAPLP